MVVALSDTVDVIEPHTFRSTSAYSVTGALYEPLLRQQFVPNSQGLLVGDGNKVEGAGASSYDIKPIPGSGFVATFHLRPEAKFSDGNPVTAADYQYVFDRTLKGPGYIGLLLPFIGLDSTDQIKVIDNLTLQITTKVQTPLFERFMTFQVFGAMEKSVADANATKDDPWAFKYFNSHAAGSGPFMLASYNPDTEIKLVPNPYYWDATSVGSSSVTVRNVPDANQRALLLQSGEIDLADGLPPRMIKDMTTKASVKVYSDSTTGLNYLGMNETIAPLNNVDVRKAILEAVPYQALIDQVMFGEATPAGGIVTSTMETYDKSIGSKYATDLTAAKASLKASGAKNVSLTLGVRQSRSSDQEAAVLIQDSLRKIGITVNIQVLADGDFLTKLGKHELPLFIHDWSSWGEDPFYQMTFLSTCGAAVNYSVFCNKSYDAAIKAGMFTTDPAARAADSSKAQKILFDNAVVAPLWSADRTIATGKCVTGVIRDYTMIAQFKLMTKSTC